MRKKPRKIDWTKLKLEYMSSDESVRATLDKNKVAQCKTSNERTKGWGEERKKLHQRIVERAKTQIVNFNVDRYKKQTKLWESVETVAEDIFKKAGDKNKPLTPKDLVNLSGAISIALKSKKLIVGEPTETIEERSLHLHLIEINKRIERGDDLKEIPFKIGEGSNIIQNKGQAKKDS